MTIKQLYTFVWILAVASLFTGCTAFDLLNANSLEAPKFKYVKHEIGTPGTSSIPIDLKFNAYNPNTVGLRNTYIRFELFAKGKRFIRGQDISLDLAPLENTEVIVPAHLHYKNVLKAGGYVAEKILSGKKSVKFKAKVTVHGSPVIYSNEQEGQTFPFAISVIKTIKVKIPRDRIEDSLSGSAKGLYKAARKIADAEEKVKKLKKLKKKLKRLSRFL